MAEKYLITGIDRSGKRFKIKTNNPSNYNIWNGSIWEIKGNKKKLITRIYN